MTKKDGFFRLSGADYGALLLAALLGSIGLASGPDPDPATDPDYFTIASAEVTEIPANQMEQVPRNERSRSLSAHAGLAAIGIGGAGAAGFGPEAIVNIGKAAWEIIKDGTPVVTTELPSASAIPSGAKWEDMSGWDEMRANGYHVVYTNMLGIRVVEFRYRISYIAGGTYKGRGRYISNISTTVDDLNVAWGYRFDASVAVPAVTNIGSVASPIASAEVLFHWSVKTPINANVITRQFAIAGTGQFSELTPERNLILP